MIMPDVLIVENYRLMSWLGVRDTIFAVGLPYFASAFGIFLLRQTFKTVPRELEEAARVEGASRWQILMKVYVPLARPIYVASGLVSVSYHRSEERRVGKECGSKCRSRGSPEHAK